MTLFPFFFFQLIQFSLFWHMIASMLTAPRLARGVALFESVRHQMNGKRRALSSTGAQADKGAAKRKKGGASVVKLTEVEPLISDTDDVILAYDNLAPAVLLRRYKRFLGDVQLTSTQQAGPAEGQADAEPTVVHVPNTGPMTGLLDTLPARVLLSVSSNAKRKYAHTLEWIQPEPEGTWVGVHSAKANAMVGQLLRRRQLPGLPPYSAIQTEVLYGSDGKSRVDFVLHEATGTGSSGSNSSGGGRGASSNSSGGGKGGSSNGSGSSGSEASTITTHVEVKSVTLAEDLPEGAGRIALFPDTVSDRAQRHVRELTALARAGGRAVLAFVVQRGDCCAFAPCHEKDPAYGRLVLEAAEAGVGVVAVACALDEGKGVVRLQGQLPVRLEYKLPSK